MWGKRNHTETVRVLQDPAVVYMDSFLPKWSDIFGAAYKMEKD